jgi:hypothetical protein
MRYLIGVALLLPMVVFAKDPPLPEALLNAKTAFVEKVGTAEESFDTYCKAPKVNAGATDKNSDKYCKSLKADAKANKQLFDKFCKELKKWGPFTLVQDRSSADVRILLARTWSNTGTRSIGTAYTLPPGYNGYRTGGNWNGAMTYFIGDRIYGTMDGKTYSVNIGSGPVYQASMPFYQASMPYEIVSPSSREEAIINIRDGRNNVLLYLDQTEGPGKLVSNLKKKMKQK